MNASLGSARSVDLEEIQTVESRSKERGLPGIETIRTKIDMLCKQSLELGGLQMFRDDQYCLSPLAE